MRKLYSSIPCGSCINTISPAFLHYRGLQLIGLQGGNEVRPMPIMVTQWCIGYMSHLVAPAELSIV
jgi:hypothetical protein